MLAVQAGQVLEQLTSSSDTITYKSVFFVALMALASIAPIYLKRKGKESTKKENWLIFCPKQNKYVIIVIEIMLSSCKIHKNFKSKVMNLISMAKQSQVSVPIPILSLRNNVDL